MINPAMLQWVRERLELSPEDVAGASAFLAERNSLSRKFSPADLMRWEAGREVPPYPAEATLAEIYGCSIYHLSAETPPTTFHGQAPNGTWWERNGGPFYYEPPVLLQPEENGPDVPDLLHPGDWLEAGYEDGPHVSTRLVLGLRRATGCVAGRIVRYWNLTVLSLRDTRSPQPIRDTGSIGEVVAWKGELRGLFQADKTVYRVLPTPPMEREAWPLWLRRKMAEMRGKHAQLSLFGEG